MILIRNNVDHCKLAGVNNEPFKKALQAVLVRPPIYHHHHTTQTPTTPQITKARAIALDFPIAFKFGSRFGWHQQQGMRQGD